MIIPKEELTHFQRWQVDSFEPKRPPEAPSSPPPSSPEAESTAEPVPPFNLPTAEEIERMHEEARASGYQAGLAEGRLAGEQQAREAAEENTRQLLSLIENLKTSIADLEQTVADQLLSLAIEIASQVTRSAINVNPDILLPLIREAIGALPLHHAHIVLRLNPKDIESVRTPMGEQLSQIGAQLIEDSTVSPGGCMLLAGASEVDATIETRWKRVLEAIGSEPQEWLTP
jgi:flagellar assembly protein FliH